MMLREALEYVAGLGKSAVTYQSLMLSKHKTMYVLGGDRDPITCDQDHPARGHTVDTLDSFVEAVSNFGCGDSEVWVGEESVIAVLDGDEYRENCIVIDLPASDQWVALIHNTDTYSQKSLIKFLKNHFDLDLPLLKALRRVDFKRSSDGSRSVEHGKETLGRSVEAAVQSIEGIPESTTLNVARYTLRGAREKYPVEVRINIDVDEESFTLRPGPNEIELFQQRATQSLLDFLTHELTATTSSVYVGKP